MNSTQVFVRRLPAIPCKTRLFCCCGGNGVINRRPNLALNNMNDKYKTKNYQGHRNTLLRFNKNNFSTYVSKVLGPFAATWNFFKLDVLSFQSRQGAVGLKHQRYFSILDDGDYEIPSGLLKKKVDSNDDELYIVDVREPSEIEMFGSIEGSKNIPLNELESALHMSEDAFLKKYGYEKPPEDGEDVVFYCHAGIRSLHATLSARRLGFERARSLAGGWSAWNETEH